MPVRGGMSMIRRPESGIARTRPRSANARASSRRMEQGAEFQAILFTLAGIGGAMLLAWMGWQRVRPGAMGRERNVRQRILVSRRDDSLEVLRRWTLEAERTASHARRYAGIARQGGDEELAGFFEEVAERDGKEAEEALDLLRARAPSPREPPPPPPA